MVALLKRCQQQNIKLNKDKFKFKCDEVSFIGHTLTQNGLKIDPAKVEAITKMRKPKDVAGVQRFIGMVKYLAKFLPRLSEVCEPLRSLTHKDAPWVWGKDHDKSFADIQKAICEAPVLKYFDHKAATEGQADASSKGLGFVLMQEGRPRSWQHVMARGEKGVNQGLLLGARGGRQETLLRGGKRQGSAPTTAYDSHYKNESKRGR
eukprot:gene13641-4539_t